MAQLTVVKHEKEQPRIESDAQKMLNFIATIIVKATITEHESISIHTDLSKGAK